MPKIEKIVPLENFAPALVLRPVSFPAFLAAFALVAALVFPVVFGIGMETGFDHDEDQHIAAGALIAREGLLPYRDFPSFHPPNLALLYAAIFKTTNHLMFAGRFVSILAAAGIVALTGAILWSVFRPRGRLPAVAVAAVAVILCLTAKVFMETTGQAWNHEPALFFAFLAAAALWRGTRTNLLVWFAIAGLAAGLAIGTRITYAPLLAPFGLTLLFAGPRSFREILLRILLFGAGALVGLAPTLILWTLDPEAAKFCLFDFAQVNINYRFATGEPRTMTFLKKLRYVFKEIVRTDFALFLAGAIPFVTVIFARRKSLPTIFWFLLALFPFVLWGAFAPSPMFEQYFYPFVPFFVLCGAFGLAELQRIKWIALVCLLLTAVALFRSAGDYGDILKIAGKPEKWIPVQQHSFAREFADKLAGQRVLTLAPAVALEGGAKIYPAFATGPFAWRVSPFVAPAQAARVSLISPATLPALLASLPPAAVILRAEPRYESFLRAWAASQGFHSHRLENRTELWLPKSSATQ